MTARSKMGRHMAKLSMSEIVGLAVTVYFNNQILNHKASLEHACQMINNYQGNNVNSLELVVRFQKHKSLMGQLAQCGFAHAAVGSLGAGVGSLPMPVEQTCFGVNSAKVEGGSGSVSRDHWKLELGVVGAVPSGNTDGYKLPSVPLDGAPKGSPGFLRFCRISHSSP